MATPDAFDSIDPVAAARRLEGVVRETPLAPFASGDPRVELRLKLECQQETGAFKARGAWNHVAQLSPAERKRGVVTVSSGNHGKALAWAAARAGVRATVVMPGDAYPNKVAACRAEGAEVVLAPTRLDAERIVAERVAAGQVLAHPYDSPRTVEGQATVGLELARRWPEVEVVLVPCGGGGMLGGVALALRRALGERVRVIGVEPAGAPKMTRALAAGEPVQLERIDTKVQGLCPPRVGRINLDLCRALVDRVLLVEDDVVLAAQRRLVREGGWTVEPAGAAAVAVVLAGRLASLAEGRTARDPLRVACVVSGGNPDPDQLAAVRAS